MKILEQAKDVLLGTFEFMTSPSISTFLMIFILISTVYMVIKYDLYEIKDIFKEGNSLIIYKVTAMVYLLLTITSYFEILSVGIFLLMAWVFISCYLICGNIAVLLSYVSKSIYSSLRS